MRMASVDSGAALWPNFTAVHRFYDDSAIHQLLNDDLLALVHKFGRYGSTCNISRLSSSVMQRVSTVHRPSCQPSLTLHTYSKGWWLPSFKHEARTIIEPHRLWMLGDSIHKNVCTHVNRLSIECSAPKILIARREDLTHARCFKNGNSMSCGEQCTPGKRQDNGAKHAPNSRIKVNKTLI